MHVDATQISAIRRESAVGVRLGVGLVMLLIAVTSTLALTPAIAPYQRMWLLAVVIYAGLKLLTVLRLGPPERLSGWRLAAYFFCWPGMRPQPFFVGAPTPVIAAALPGALKLIAGAGILWLGTRLLPSEAPAWLRAWTGMVAFTLLLHFGIFHLLAVAWQHCGVPVEPLFHGPTDAVSLAEFWGARWNRAFSDFSRDLILKPLSRWTGVRAAGFVVFLFSGLVHDLVISVPAGGGYGMPTLYFVFQGVLVLFEGARSVRAWSRAHPVLGRLWTAAALLVPVPLLFPPPFLEHVVLPFLAAIGGGS